MDGLVHLLKRYKFTWIFGGLGSLLFGPPWFAAAFLGVAIDEWVHRRKQRKNRANGSRATIVPAGAPATADEEAKKFFEHYSVVSPLFGNLNQFSMIFALMAAPIYTAVLLLAHHVAPSLMQDWMTWTKFLVDGVALVVPIIDTYTVELKALSLPERIAMTRHVYGMIWIFAVIQATSLAMTFPKQRLIPELPPGQYVDDTGPRA